MTQRNHQLVLLTISLLFSSLPGQAETNKGSRSQPAQSTTSALKGASTKATSTSKDTPGNKNKTKVSAGPGKKVRGFTLWQNSSYRGAVQLDVCPIGARLKSQDLECVMEPNRTVAFLMHRSNKRYMEIDPSKGLKGLGHLSWFPGPEVVTKIGDETLRGKYKDSKGNWKSWETKSTHYLIVKHKPGNPVPQWLTDLWVGNDLGISKEFAGRCARICLMPSEYGLPLKLVRTYNNSMRRVPQSKEEIAQLQAKWGYCMTHPKFQGGDVRVLLNLLEKRDAELNVNDFKLAPGFKKVTTEVDLVMNEEKEKMLRELEEDDN